MCSNFCAGCTQVFVHGAYKVFLIIFFTLVTAVLFCILLLTVKCINNYFLLVKII